MTARDPIAEVNLMDIRNDGPVDHWLVEAIDEDGGVHRAEFYGKHAEEDARIWAGAAYPETGFTVMAPPVRRPFNAKPKLTIVGGKDAREVHSKLSGGG